jgi:16S rRNA (uracil1498-N3)-methyltransferase
MRRFYAPRSRFSGHTVVLDGHESRHLRDVLRLKRGDEVHVFDGEGREFLCRVELADKTGTMLRLDREVSPVSPESPLDLTLAAAVLKGEKFDLVVQKAVELGLTTLIPLQTARCDVKISNAEKKLDRWRKIALEAAKQSGRARLLEIPRIFDLPAFLDDHQGSGDLIMFSERGGDSFASVKPAKKITALIGPEGGWEDSEIEAAREKGSRIVTLGGRILRAETAAISIAAILQHRFGDMS